MLTACLLATRFSARCELQRLRERQLEHAREPNPDARVVPIVVYNPNSNDRAVVDCTPDVPARRGDALAAVRARCPDALAVEEDRDHYRRRWQDVIDKLLTVADRVEDAAIGRAYVALEGMETMHGGRRQLLDSILDAVPSWLMPRLGVAQGKFQARCAAIVAQPGVANVLPPDRDAATAVIASLPVRVLPLETQHLLMLDDFGISTLGDLARQPLSAIQAQLGRPGRRAWELANGTDTEPLAHLDHAVSVSQSIQLLWPVVSMDALSFAVHSVIQDAFRASVRRDRSVGRVELVLKMSEHADWSLSRTFKEPLGDASAAARIVMQVISAAAESEPSPLRGPINEVQVSLSNFGPPRAEQVALWAEEREGDLETTLKQLAAAFRTPMMTTVVDVEPWSRIPERRQALSPLTGR